MLLSFCVVGAVGDLKIINQYQYDAVANFQKAMSDINAVELQDDAAEQLIAKATEMGGKVDDESDEDAMSFAEEIY